MLCIASCMIVHGKKMSGTHDITLVGRCSTSFKTNVKTKYKSKNAFANSYTEHAACL